MHMWPIGYYNQVLEILMHEIFGKIHALLYINNLKTNSNASTRNLFRK